MKIELVVAQDVALFGKLRKTGTVLGAFEMPDSAKIKPDTVAVKLRNALANANLEFRVAKTKNGTKGKGGKPDPK